MGKAWQIFKYEYARHVFRWRFLMTLLSPLMLALVGAFVIIIAFITQVNLDPVGYVDYAQVFTTGDFSGDIYNPILGVEFLPYPNEVAARAALDRKAIQAYFVIPADFHQNGKTRMVYQHLPFSGAVSQFYTMLRIRLLVDLPIEITRRVIDGPEMSIQITTDGQREKFNQVLQVAMAIGISYLVIFAIGQCSGYLSQALADEKENRTIEILATSAAPIDIIAGKLIGLASVGLTQLMFWGGFPLVGFFLFLAFSPSLYNAVDRLSIFLLTLTIIPTFFLCCCLIILGIVLSGDSRIGQSIAMMTMFIAMVPVMFSGILKEDWSGGLILFLSFFPLTATCTLALRWAFASVPFWQMLVSIAIMVLTTIGIFWLTVRAFRRSQLLTGRQIDWKRILYSIRFFKAKKGQV